MGPWGNGLCLSKQVPPVICDMVSEVEPIDLGRVIFLFVQLED
jgi:hypothetical protein